MYQPLCQWDCQNWLAKIRPCNSRCAIGCVKKSLSKEVSVKVAAPLRFEMQRLPTKATWHMLCHWVCQKKFVKRRLCNSRSAIGIRDAENLERGYMAHAAPLVFVANLFVKSSNISVCGMSRLNLVTFRFSVGCRCAIGIVTQWCDFPPCDVTFLYLAVTLGDVTFRRVMWLKPGACSVTCLRATTQLVLKSY